MMNSIPLYESKKITELATLTSASLSGQDIIPIIDNSQKETKSVTVTELEKYFQSLYPITSSYAITSRESSYAYCSTFSTDAQTASFASNVIMVLDTGSCSTSRCGNNNRAMGDCSTIGGGTSNLTFNFEGTIAGGAYNSVMCSGSTVGGGRANYSNGDYSTIGGGFGNYAAGLNSTVAGGQCNKTTCWYSVIAGGQYNCATGLYSSVLGGTENNASGSYSVAGGGRNNLVDGNCSGILGGYNNCMSGSNNSFIIGSELTANADWTTFVNNLCVKGMVYADGIAAAISVGGDSIMVTGSGAGSTMRAINNNNANGTISTVPGGYCNTVTGCAGTIGGGQCNVVGGVFGIVAGGRYNCVPSNCSGIFGGHNNNTCAYTDAFIIGSNLNATANCTTFVNNLCVEGSVFGTSSYAITSSYVKSSSYAEHTPGMVGSIIIYPSATPPSGWLLCDGELYNTSLYPALTSLIGTNYGLPLSLGIFITPETVYNGNPGGAYGGGYGYGAGIAPGALNDGTVKFTPTGGSGFYRVVVNGSTQYINGVGNSATYTSLNSDTYAVVFEDLGVTPSTLYSGSFSVPYGGSVSTTTMPLVGSTYRTPSLNHYLSTSIAITPLSYIIKT
jgi:Phage Tail Collar Domain